VLRGRGSKEHEKRLSVEKGSEKKERPTVKCGKGCERFWYEGGKNWSIHHFNELQT